MYLSYMYTYIYIIVSMKIYPQYDQPRAYGEDIIYCNLDSRITLDLVQLADAADVHKASAEGRSFFFFF